MGHRQWRDGAEEIDRVQIPLACISHAKEFVFRLALSFLSIFPHNIDYVILSCRGIAKIPLFLSDFYSLTLDTFPI